MVIKLISVLHFSLCRSRPNFNSYTTGGLVRSLVRSRLIKANRRQSKQRRALLQTLRLLSYWCVHFKSPTYKR